MIATSKKSKENKPAAAMLNLVIRLAATCLQVGLEKTSLALQMFSKRCAGALGCMCTRATALFVSQPL